MKKILLLITAILVLFACKKKNTQGMLLIDTEHTTVEGSFVQGTVNSNLCKTVIPYSNSNGGSAEITADEVNGVKIEKQNITLNNGTGEIKVNITGTPLLLQSTFLQVQIKYEGKTYITSIDVPIASDPNPDGTVTFTINNTPVVGLTTSTSLNFTVDPTMTSVINTTATPIQGLTVTITPNSTTGQGTVTFTPSATFIGGTVQLTAQFGARPTQVVDIPVNYFANGDGTSAHPFEITDAVSLAKVQYGTATQYFKVMNNFDAGTWTPIASFNTNLDGNSKTITYTTNIPTADSVALIKKINGGTIKDLTLTGTATGKNLVAGLATWSAITPTGCISTVNVTGTNNLANLIASGAGKDASTLTVTGTLPTSLNIVVPATAGSIALGVMPQTVDVAFSNNLTMATFTYNTGTGKIDATMPLPATDFVPGNINYDIRLSASGTGSFVHLSQQTMAVTYTKPYDSGNGIAGDPYIVADADQLYQTMKNYSSSYIKLKNNIAMTSAWPADIATFSGDLDGDKKTISNLLLNVTTANTGFVRINTGKIHDIAFTGVSATTNNSFGVVAGINNGIIQNIYLKGTITSTLAGDLCGSIAGDMLTSGALITNCYVDVTINSSAGMLGGIAGRASAGCSVTYCTSVGTLSQTTRATTRVGGIVGRGEGAFTIKGCLSSMTITTYTGTNGVGGIFGADNTNAGSSISECMFTGTVSGDFGVGGIGGVGPNVKNCLVENATISNKIVPTSGNGASGGINGTNKYYCDNSITRNTNITATGSIATSPAAGSNSYYQNNGKTRHCVVIGGIIQTSASSVASRISGTPLSTDPLVDNWASGVTLKDGTGATVSPTANAAGQDGGDAPATMDQAWYTTLTYDFTNIWDWDVTNSRPKLKKVGCNPSVIP